MKRYEQYKDSGIEWIGEIPSHWNQERMRFLYRFRSGMGNKKPEDFGEGFPFLTYKDVYECDTADNPSGLVKSSLEDQERYSICRGDAFFTGSSETIGELGFSSVALNDIPLATFNGFTIRARPVDQSLHPDYSRYLFRSDVVRGYLTQRDNSITRANLSQQTLGDLVVLIPPLDEQSQIADFLDKATVEIDTLIEETEKSIELLKEYRKSIISEAVTKGLNPDAPMKDSDIEWIGKIPEHWKIKKFKYVASVRANLVDPRDYSSLKQVSPEKLEKDTGKLLECQTVFEAGVESDNHLFKKGQLLYSKVRPALNKVTIAPFDGLCSADMYPIETDECPGWLLYAMLSQPFVAQVRVSTDRVKMPKVNKEELRAFWLPVPPVEEQEEIAKYLNSAISSIEATISNQKQLVSSLQEYRKSLISEAVTGKFKVPEVH